MNEFSADVSIDVGVGAAIRVLELLGAIGHLTL
jgi:hypothetical protein